MSLENFQKMVEIISYIDIMINDTINNLNDYSKDKKYIPYSAYFDLIEYIKARNELEKYLKDCEIYDGE